MRQAGQSYPVGIVTQVTPDRHEASFFLMSKKTKQHGILEQCYTSES